MSHPIIVEGVSKQFRLQADRPTSVKEFFTRRDRDKAETHFWALDDVSLEIPEGSMYALIGHNGCGKSTLLRCIAGIYQPDRGNVKISGRISTLLELGAGFHPDLSGRENVYLNATILGMTRKEIDKAFDDIVSFAGDKIGQFIDSPVKVYSTGMYVRLGFSVAVHVQPEILIIDEVIAVGDEQFQRQCFDHLYKLRKDGTTIVVVTHGLGIVQTMCDGAAWLDHGQLQQVGSGPDIAAAYLGRVNQAEADTRAEARLDVEHAGTVSDPDASEPAGEPITLERVEFLDDDGHEITSAVHRRPLTMRVHFDANRAVEDPIFGFALFSSSGIHLTGTNTQIDAVPTGTLLGKGSIDFRIPELPLVPGEFELSVSIADKHLQHFFERREREWRLIVRNGGELAPHGLMDLRGAWHIDAP